MAAGFETQFQTQDPQPTTYNRFRSVGPAPPQSLQPQGRYSPTAAKSTAQQTHRSTPQRNPQVGLYIPAPGSPFDLECSPAPTGTAPHLLSPSLAAIQPALCLVPALSAPARRSSGT